MRTFIDALTERGYRNKTVAFIENGSWAPTATTVMKKLLEKSKNLEYAENNITIKSAVNEATLQKIEALAKELCN
jgi:flavorubredoxin